MLFAIKKRHSRRFLSPYDSAPQLDIEMFDNPVGNPVLYGSLRNQGHIGVKAVRWYACEYEPFSYLKITPVRASHVLGSRESEAVGSLGFGLSSDLFIQVGCISRTVFIEFTEERDVDYRQLILLGVSSFSIGELERISRRSGARAIVAEGDVDTIKRRSAMRSCCLAADVHACCVLTLTTVPTILPAYFF